MSSMVSKFSETDEWYNGRVFVRVNTL